MKTDLRKTLPQQTPLKDVYLFKYFCFQNLVVGIKQISEFLGFSLTDEQIRTISTQCTFQAMRENSQETHGAIGPFLFRKGKVAFICGVLCRPHSDFALSRKAKPRCLKQDKFFSFNKN